MAFTFFEGLLKLDLNRDYLDFTDRSAERRELRRDFFMQITVPLLGLLWPLTHRNGVAYGFLLTFWLMGVVGLMVALIVLQGVQYTNTDMDMDMESTLTTIDMPTTSSAEMMSTFSPVSADDLFLPGLGTFFRRNFLSFLLFICQNT